METRVAKYDVYISEHYTTFLSLTKEVSSVCFHSEYEWISQKTDAINCSCFHLSFRMMTVFEV